MSEKDVARAEAEGLEKFFKLTSSINCTNMICFDSGGKIRKYETPEEILEDFYPLRLQYYQKRKDHVSAEIQTDLERLNNQARFVQMIINKKLVVSNRKKADIVAELRELQCRPFPKINKAKSAGETEAVVENEVDDDEIAAEIGVPTNADFDYLLGMAIWNLTKEKIDKLLGQAKEQEQQLIQYLKLSPTDLWNTDLETFLEEWKRIIDEDEVELAGSKPRKKGTTIKTRKSLTRKRKGDYGDSDDDDFESTKPQKAAVSRKNGNDAPKARAAAVKAKVEATDEDSDSDEVISVKPKKAASSKKNDDDGPAARSIAIKAKIGAAAAAFATSEDEDEEDENPEPRRNRISLNAPPSEPSDLEMKPAPKGKAAQKAAPSKPAVKRKSSAMSGDSDSDGYIKPAPKKKQKTLDEFVAVNKPKPTKPVPAKKPAAKKTKAFDSDAEDVESDKVSSNAKPRTPPSKRAGAARAKKPQYVDLSSEEEADKTEDKSDVFELSD